MLSQLTVAEVMQIVRENEAWCLADRQAAIDWLAKYPENMQASELVRLHGNEIHSEWAYFWARKFTQDRDIVRERVTEPEWACRFADKFPAS